MKMRFSITLLLLTSFLMAGAQDKTSRVSKPGVSFTFLLHKKREQKVQPDTVYALITVGHKIKSTKPSESFRGFVVYSGSHTRYYCESWKQMPAYYFIRKIDPL